MDPIPEAVPKDEASSQDGPEAVADISKKVTERFQRANTPETSSRHEFPTVTDDTSYAAVKAGAKYIDRAGTKHVKPWDLSKSVDPLSAYNEVPEGSYYISPKGTLHQKPTFEPLNFTEQALYDMAPSASKKKAALSLPSLIKIISECTRSSPA